MKTAYQTTQGLLILYWSYTRCNHKATNTAYQGCILQTVSEHISTLIVLKSQTCYMPVLSTNRVQLSNMLNTNEIHFLLTFTYSLLQDVLFSTM